MPQIVATGREVKIPQSAAGTITLDRLSWYLLQYGVTEMDDVRAYM
jgi:hypothetical protein